MSERRCVRRAKSTNLWNGREKESESEKARRRWRRRDIENYKKLKMENITWGKEVERNEIKN